MSVHIGYPHRDIHALTYSLCEGSQSRNDVEWSSIAAKGLLGLSSEYVTYFRNVISSNGARGGGGGGGGGGLGQLNWSLNGRPAAGALQSLQPGRPTAARAFGCVDLLPRPLEALKPITQRSNAEVLLADLGAHGLNNQTVLVGRLAFKMGPTERFYHYHPAP